MYVNLLRIIYLFRMNNNQPNKTYQLFTTNRTDCQLQYLTVRIKWGLISRFFLSPNANNLFTPKRDTYIFTYLYAIKMG